MLKCYKNAIKFSLKINCYNAQVLQLIKHDHNSFTFLCHFNSETLYEF